MEINEEVKLLREYVIACYAEDFDECGRIVNVFRRDAESAKETGKISGTNDTDRIEKLARELSERFNDGHYDPSSWDHYTDAGARGGLRRIARHVQKLIDAAVAKARESDAEIIEQMKINHTAEMVRQEWEHERSNAV